MSRLLLGAGSTSVVGNSFVKQARKGNLRRHIVQAAASPTGAYRVGAKPSYEQGIQNDVLETLTADYSRNPLLRGIACQLPLRSSRPRFASRTNDARSLMGDTASSTNAVARNFRSVHEC